MNVIRANELFEQIHSGEIKDGSKINVIKDDRIIDTIEYKDGGLKWKQGGNFSTKCLCDIDTEFEVVEIDIQEIEDLGDSSMSENRDIAIENRIKINELIEAIKQLDRKMEEKDYGI